MAADRMNYARNGRARTAANGWSINSGLGTLTPGQADFPGSDSAMRYTAATSTSGNARLLCAAYGTAIPASTQITVSFRIRADQAVSFSSIVLRRDVNISTANDDNRTILSPNPTPVPAGISEWSFTALTPPLAPASTAGLVFTFAVAATPGNGTVVRGALIDITDVIVELGPTGGPYFDGDTPDVAATTSRDGWDYEWTGDPEVTASTATVVPRIVIPSYRHAPTVSIAGYEIAADASGTVVALSGLEVVWGRHGLYDPNEPAALRLELLDRDGAFASDPALFQSPIVISTDVGVLFRGTVDKIETRLHQYDGDFRWRVVLTAVDAGIGVLARLITQGTGNTQPGLVVHPEWISAWGGDYWDTGMQSSADGNTRFRDLRAAIEPFTDVTITNPGLVVLPAPNGQDAYPQIGPGPSGDDIYTLLCQAMQTHVFIQPTSVLYDPAAHEVRPQYLAAEAALVLEYADGVIQATPAADADGTVSVPARTVVFDPTQPLTATVATNVTTILGEEAYTVLSEGTQTWDNVPGIGSYSTPPAPQHQVLAYDIAPTGALGNGRTSYDTQSLLSTQENAVIFLRFEQLAQYHAPIVQALNGKLYAPPLTFDLEAFQYDDAIEQALLLGYDPGWSWTFPGAVYEALTGWGPWFQLLGATLTYTADEARGGWRIAGLFGPARATEGGIPMNELVTDDEPTFDQYAPQVTLSTLGQVTAGI